MAYPSEAGQTGALSLSLSPPFVLYELSRRLPFRRRRDQWWRRRREKCGERETGERLPPREMPARGGILGFLFRTVDFDPRHTATHQQNLRELRFTCAGFIR